MSFAVIETGSKQYTIAEGDSIQIEKLGDDMDNGDTVTFDSVLLFDDGEETQIGDPYLEDTTVEAELVGQGRKEKVTVLRFKPKTRHKRKKGHRQPYMEVEITDIS